MINKVVTVYAIVDDLLGETHAEETSARFHPLLKAIGHQEDNRSKMSDSEVITTAIVAAMFFGSNHQNACDYLHQHNLIPNMLGKSRFNRRWHRLAMLTNDLFHQLGMVFKEISEGTDYLLDSFPVAMCDNIRIFNVRLIRSEDYRGYIASKKRYFYGIRVHLITTQTGIPVEMSVLPGEANDVRGLNSLPLNFPAGSQIYMDAGYTDYLSEDDLEAIEQSSLKVMRKQNSKRKEPAWVAYTKQKVRHYIETVFSQIVSRFPRSIHAVTYAGFVLKIEMFIWSFTLEKAWL